MNPYISSGAIQKVTVPVLIAVLALGAGYYAGQYVGRQKQEQMLKEVFSSANFINALSGKITAISPDKSSVSVEVDSVMGISLPKEYQNKTVLITGDTKIVMREHKSQEILSAEIAKYQASTASTKGTKNAIVITPPSPYSERALIVDELRVGDSIHFSSKSEIGWSANVLDNQFTAIEVSVTRQ